MLCFSDVVRLIPNVAPRGIATQSENHINTRYAASPFIASYANDGDLGSSMVTTSTRGLRAIAEVTPPVWWQVDLLKVYEITKVAITRRQAYGKYVFQLLHRWFCSWNNKNYLHI